MAYDKAVDSAALDSGLTTIADAIRAKGGTAAPLEFPQGMADAVAAIPSGGEDSEKIIRELLDGTIQEITLDSVTVIKKPYAFQDSKSITKVSMPNLTLIGASYNTFFNCVKLKSVYMPKLESIISREAFCKCSTLESVILPSLYRLDHIGIFKSCEKLTRADFGGQKSDRSFIKDASFMGDVAFETLILRKTGGIWELWATNAFNGTKIVSGIGYIYVPKALVDQYKTATNWVTYADQIRAIEDYPEITGGAV